MDRYVYTFTLWPDTGNIMPRIAKEFFFSQGIRRKMIATPDYFADFCAALYKVGLVVRKVRRVPFVPPEWVFC